MRTPEGWHKARLGIRHCFKMTQTPKTRTHNGSELRFATVLAIICRPTLRRFAPSLRAQFSFFTLPGVPRLRRSTARLFYSAPPGLKFRVAYARKISPPSPPSTSDLSGRGCCVTTTQPLLWWGEAAERSGGFVSRASSEVDAVAEHAVHVGVAAAELGGEVDEDGAVVLITHGDVQA